MEPNNRFFSVLVSEIMVGRNTWRETEVFIEWCNRSGTNGILISNPNLFSLEKSTPCTRHFSFSLCQQIRSSCMVSWDHGFQVQSFWLGGEDREMERESGEVMDKTTMLVYGINLFFLQIIKKMDLLRYHHCYCTDLKLVKGVHTHTHTHYTWRDKTLESAKPSQHPNLHSSS